MLIRRGWSLNLKRVRRLWNEMGLRRPLRLRKRRKLGPKPGVRPTVARINLLDLRMTCGPVTSSTIGRRGDVHSSG